ncbi:hypothetical protein NDU88_007982 [Pleurodeles waltl]|uniref:Uncharacterized protein n=1 Tax=Pleurodeles waltl TaxID=8319 RepID=A0AAV7VTV4_PLEWA|nr:hypothetical protein NDU88_007982 [Pleurodeles waltl]
MGATCGPQVPLQYRGDRKEPSRSGNEKVPTRFTNYGPCYIELWDTPERGEVGRGDLRGGTAQWDCCKHEPRRSLDETLATTHHTLTSERQKESLGPTIQAQFDCILEAIADTKTALQQDIGVVSVGLGLLQAEHRKLVEKMTEVEKVVEDMQPTRRDLKKQMGN